MPILQGAVYFVWGNSPGGRCLDLLVMTGVRRLHKDRKEVRNHQKYVLDRCGDWVCGPDTSNGDFHALCILEPCADHGDGVI